MTRKEAMERIKVRFDKLALDDKDIEAIQTLIPELRESEDERIRKELIEFIKWSVDRHFMREDFHQAKRPSEWIAYLEKQKKRTSGIILKTFENSKTDYSLEEREEASDYSEKVLPTSIACGENEEEYLLHKVIEAAYIAGQKEQKSAKWHPTHEQMVALTWAANGIDNNSPCAGDIKASLRSLYNDLQSKSIRPAEWSEEDEKTLDCIINVLDRLGFEEYCKSSRDQDVEEERFYYKEIQCLKKLKSLRPQIIDSAPLYTIEQVDEKIREAQEWSEEDEKMLENIRYALSYALCNSVIDEQTTEYVMTWLKSLRPPQYCENCKLKRSVENWKPSEEQMNALNALNCHGDLSYVGQQNQLISLYNDLKKLI